MDKQTLSNYGWLTIVTLILAVMLAFATPFGNYIGDAVVSVANGFVGASDAAIDEDNISANEDKWDSKFDYSGFGDNSSHSGKIPTGGTYITGITYNTETTCSTCGGYSWCVCNATTYKSGDNFPATATKNDLYIYGDYAYMYQVTNAYMGGNGCPYTIPVEGGDIIGFWDSGDPNAVPGWQVSINTTMTYPEGKTQYGQILGAINNQPITSIYNTFYGCTNLTTAPDLSHLSDITLLSGAFRDCTALTGEIVFNTNKVPNHTDYYFECLANTTKPITIKGIDPSLLSLIKGTANNNNVTIG